MWLTRAAVATECPGAMFRFQSVNRGLDQHSWASVASCLKQRCTMQLAVLFSDAVVPAKNGPADVCTGGGSGARAAR